MKKSLLKGIILSLFFGPFGLFYSSVVLGIVLVVATPIIGFLSGEVPIGLWPISIVVSIFAVRRHNSRLKQELLRVSLSAENVGQKPVDDKDAGRRADLTASRKNAARSQSRKVDRISEKEAAFNRGSPGYVDGKHFTTYIEQVKHLKREERHDEAIALLLNLIAATEAESRESGGPSGVAPWYYEQLAIIYRKVKRHSDEVAVLERYEGQTKAPGVGPQRLAERLTKAKEILTKERLKGGSEESEAEQSKLNSRGAQIKTDGASPKSWRLEPEGFEAGQQAEQARQRAKKDRVSSSKQLMSDPLPPIVGTDRIAELLRSAKTELAEPQNSETGLVDFRISRTEEFAEEQETLNKQTGRWIQPGEIVKVGNFEVQRGFFYVGGQLKGLDDYYLDNDPSLIDPTLLIDSKSPDYAGIQMDYSPSYSWITPQSRAAYLEWLASDRTDPEAYIGYVFLYFYGMERRLLIDDTNGQVSEDERKALVQELKRLKNTYGDHRSFHSYVTALLSYTWTIHNRTRDAKPDYCLLVANRGFTPAFKFLLAQTVQNGNPIDADLALAWVRSHPEFTLRTPARRCPVEFDMLFKMRYRSKFGDGLEITPNRTRLQLDYFPASASLRGYQSLRLDLPDVSRLKGPVKKLIPLAESCASELDPFSRFVGRPGNTYDSLSALALLPNDLTTLISNPRFENLKAWMKTQVTDSTSLVSLDSILLHFGKDAPLKINKKEAEMLSSLVEKAGYGVAPDSRFHHAKPDIGGKIVLFPGGHGESFSPTSEFRKVGTILRLGTLVAVTDDHVSDSEVKALKNVISQDSRLTETEKRSLDAYMLWRLNTPANMSGLKKRLDLLSASEKVAISHILVGVALADGKIDPAEINQLDKLYTQLGLDNAMIANDIQGHSFDGLPNSDFGKMVPSVSPARTQAGSASPTEQEAEKAGYGPASGIKRDKPGFVEGAHFTSYIERVKQFKRDQKHEEAIVLLLKLVAATEAESSRRYGVVAPWYYEQLAIIYRKERRFADEVAILERFQKHTKVQGKNSERLAERLTKARANIPADLDKEKNIPSETPTKARAAAYSTFSLNRNLLKRYEEETKEAQFVLESIFAEEDLDEEHEIETPNNVPANNGAIEGLDIQYQELYGRLITKADWTNEELEELCDELQLMTAGAVETINDWAFDRVGAPLIEDGSTVFVDLDLAEEISTMQMQEQMQ